MKKLIQICSMLCLVFVFSAFSAKAQVATKYYAADIPFDFSIGQKSYQSGRYIIKVTKYSLNNVSLTLEDKNKNILQTMFLRGKFNASKSLQKLIFSRNGERTTLAQMVTQESAFVLPASNNQKRTLRAKTQPDVQTEVVTVASN